MRLTWAIKASAHLTLWVMVPNFEVARFMWVGEPKGRCLHRMARVYVLVGRMLGREAREKFLLGITPSGMRVKL
jgi:hypothetical protein